MRKSFECLFYLTTRWSNINKLRIINWRAHEEKSTDLKNVIYFDYFHHFLMNSRNENDGSDSETVQSVHGQPHIFLQISYKRYCNVSGKDHFFG